MLAIPRDLWSEIPYGNKPGDWAQAKINTAYSYGQFYKYPGGGAAAAVAAVQHDFSITVDHNVVIDWVGFVQRPSSHCRTRRPGRPSLAACQTNETYSAREIGPPTAIGRFASIGARLTVGTTPYRWPIAICRSAAVPEMSDAALAEGEHGGCPRTDGSALS